MANTLIIINKTRFGALVCLLTAVIGSGCTQKGNSRSGLDVPEPATRSDVAVPSPVGADGLSAAGTGDLGGGNGINGKVFEDYVVDITKTPEWSNQLASIDAKVSAAFRVEGDVDTQGVLYSIAKSMKWYVVPMKLEELPKERIGLNVTRDPIQQLALQTEREVWIEREPHGRMDSDARAMLYLHEMVMALYKTQFMTMAEMCVRFSPKPLSCETNMFQKAVWLELELLNEERFKPRPKRELTSSDYESIRAMTDWLKATQDTMMKEVLWDEFKRYGFDLRMRPIDLTPTSTKQTATDLPMEWTPKEIQTAIANSKYLGHLPTVCRYGKDAAENCEVDFAFEPEARMVPIPDSPKTQTVRVIVASKNSGLSGSTGGQTPGQTREFQVQLSEHNGAFPSSSFLETDAQGERGVGVVALAVVNPSTQEGDLVHRAFFVMKGTKDLPLLKGIVIVPYRVIKREGTKSYIGTQFEFTLARPVENQEPFLVISSKEGMTALRLLLLAMPSMTTMKAVALAIDPVVTEKREAP